MPTEASAGRALVTLYGTTYHLRPNLRDEPLLTVSAFHWYLICCDTLVASGNADQRNAHAHTCLCVELSLRKIGRLNLQN